MKSSELRISNLTTIECEIRKGETLNVPCVIGIVDAAGNTYELWANIVILGLYSSTKDISFPGQQLIG